jgi:ribosomal protein S18 acetylase RimI-like enzyme
MQLAFSRLTPAVWHDFEAIFAARGCSVARGCWCMYYRQSGALDPAPPGLTRGQANRAAMQALVEAGHSPGLIGYRREVPVGWVSLGPREEYLKLARSPVMRPVDDTPVWSVICFVVPGDHRSQGVARALLDGAIGHARQAGARTLEAYPVDKPDRSSDDSLWFGTRSMYDRAGFREIARRKPHRPIMRLDLADRPHKGLRWKSSS